MKVRHISTGLISYNENEKGSKVTRCIYVTLWPPPFLRHWLIICMGEQNIWLIWESGFCLLFKLLIVPIPRTQLHILWPQQSTASFQTGSKYFFLTMIFLQLLITSLSNYYISITWFSVLKWTVKSGSATFTRAGVRVTILGALWCGFTFTWIRVFTEFCAVLWKSIPHDFVACRITFNSNNLKYSFSETLSLSHCYGGF